MAAALPPPEEPVPSAGAEQDARGSELDIAEASRLLDEIESELEAIGKAIAGFGGAARDERGGRPEGSASSDADGPASAQPD